MNAQRLFQTMTFLLFICSLTQISFAQKPGNHVGQNPASDTREGGEIIADAIEIPIGAWNWSDTGATCDNIDDYDEACPYEGSTSPDVVYSFDYYGCSCLILDTSGSLYDTKLFIYDLQMNLLACNDDYNPDYTSRIEFFSEYVGMIYIVVDGYGGDCGEYVLTAEGVYPPPPYGVDCVADSQIENEPYPIDGYVDQFNGGCDAEQHNFQQLFPNQGNGLDFCGNLGWYVTNDIAQRDSDWFQVIASGDEIIWTVDSQYFGTVCRSAGVLDCDEPVIAQQEMIAGMGVEATMIIPTIPGEMVTLWVMPNSDDEPICFPDPFEYVFNLTGVNGTVATKSLSWDGMKSFYRY